MVYCLIRKKVRLLIGTMAVLMIITGCAVPPIPPGEEVAMPALTRLSPSEYPPFVDIMPRASLESAVERSLNYYSRLPETRVIRFGDYAHTVREMRETLWAFLSLIRSPLSPTEKAKRIVASFDIYKSTAECDDGGLLFTGYYEPLLRGALVETDDYRYPIYRVPEDHVVIDLGRFKEKYRGETIVARIGEKSVEPYFTREEIDVHERLAGKGLEIAWLTDPIDIFFLQIQGSGAIELRDGTIIQVSYAASNGQPYRSLGRHMAETGRLALDEITMDSIKGYLHDHPHEVDDLLSHNESYVFFRVVEKGPVGALNIPVTAWRTIATDLSLYPPGALAFISVDMPVIDGKGTVASWEKKSWFVLNQDTGGAFRGRPDKADIFCGRGIVARVTASHMKNPGDLYFLVKKRDVPVIPVSEEPDNR